MASRRSLKGGEPADRPLAGGVGATVPNRVQRVDQGVDTSLNVGAWGAVDVSRHSSPGHVKCNWNGGDRSCSRDANAGASTAISVLRHSLPECVDDGQRLDNQVGAWGAPDVSYHSSPGHVERDWNGSDRSRSRDANAGASTTIGVLRHSLPGRVDDGWRLDNQVDAWGALAAWTCRTRLGRQRSISLQGRKRDCFNCNRRASSLIAWACRRQLEVGRSSRCLGRT